MKKEIIIVPILAIIICIAILSYKAIDTLFFNSQLSNIGEYTFKQDEKTIIEFSHNKKNYIITSYFEEGNTYNDLNIIIKNKEKKYLLKNIPKCQTDLDRHRNIYIKDNSIYVHCIGLEGNIQKYTIEDNVRVSEDILKLKYDKVPNISEIHVVIDKVDDTNIYVSSLPLNMSSKNPKAKCSLEKFNCEYYT